MAVAAIVAAAFAPVAALAAETLPSPPTLTLRPSENPFNPSGKLIAGEIMRFDLSFAPMPDTGITAVSIRFPVEADVSRVGITDIEVGGTNESVSVEVTPGVVTVSFAEPVVTTEALEIGVSNILTSDADGDFVLSGVVDTTRGALVFSELDYTLSPAGALLRVVRWVEGITLVHLFFSPTRILEAAPFLAKGWLLSILIVALSYPTGIPLGLALAFMKMSRVPPLRWFAAAYINVIRGTPIFLQIFFVFFGLPLLGFAPNLIVRSWLVLSINTAAYMAEIFRAGIQSIHKGQLEAASSLGMTYPQAMAYVIIPQTIRRILPTMTSEFILLFKDTALLAAVGVFELMYYGKNDVAVSGNASAYVGAALFYLLLTIPLIRLVGLFEERLAISETGRVPPGRGGGTAISEVSEGAGTPTSSDAALREGDGR